MLGSYVMVIQGACFLNRQLHYPFGAWRQPNFSLHYLIAATDTRFDGLTHLVQIDPQALENVPGHAFVLAHEAKEEMFGAYVRMSEALRFFLSPRQHVASALG